jgi:hypothetical protein
MSTDQVVGMVLQFGGVLRLEGDNVRCSLPVAAAHLACELRERKPELITLLRRVGGRIACFPACTRCTAYCLFREGNAGPFECQRCGLAGIEEHAARIASFLVESRSPGRVM